MYDRNKKWRELCTVINNIMAFNRLLVILMGIEQFGYFKIYKANTNEIYFTNLSMLNLTNNN